MAAASLRLFCGGGRRARGLLLGRRLRVCTARGIVHRMGVDYRFLFYDGRSCSARRRSTRRPTPRRGVVLALELASTAGSVGAKAQSRTALAPPASWPSTAKGLYRCRISANRANARNRTSIEPNTVQPWYNRTTSPKLTRLKSHYSLQSTLCELSLRPTEAGGGSFDGVQGFVWLAREPTTSCTTNAATSGLLQ